MNTLEQFKEYVQKINAKPTYTKPLAFGLGIRRSKAGKTLDVNFPAINWDSAFGTAALLQDVTGYETNSNGFVVLTKAQLQKAFDNFSAFHHEIEKHPNITLLQQLLENYNQPKGYQEIDLIAYFLFDKDTAVADAVEGYFKLQCLSQLHVQPHGLSLEGVFGKLNNIAWTNQGPVLPEDLSEERIKATFKGDVLQVSHANFLGIIVSNGFYLQSFAVYLRFTH